MSQKNKDQLVNFYKTCDKFAELIEEKKPELMALLTVYETHDAAEDEIMRSLVTLRGFPKEMDAIDNPLENLMIATFFPLNLPLYSLVLFGVAPSIFSQHVFIRPPEVMQPVLEKIWKILDIDQFFSNISLHPTPRHIFVDLYASTADVIVFTGKYENALDIHKKCPEALLVYNGSGINPFLLFANANVQLAVDKAIEMRCFNSGQDCAGPDIFLVPSALGTEFVDLLKEKAQKLVVGSTKSPKTDIGPTIKQKYIDHLEDWLEQEKSHIVYKGKIDKKKRLVHPYIIRKNVTEHAGTFHEFFAPVFYVLEYDSTKDLEKLILSDLFKQRGMYVSVFGDNQAVEKKLTFVRLLKNVIVNDVEIGNTEYGGYGIHANFLLFKGKQATHPVLISRDVHQTLR